MTVHMLWLIKRLSSYTILHCTILHSAILMLKLCGICKKVCILVHFESLHYVELAFLDSL